MHYLLIYDYVSDILERRAAYRDEHLGLAWQAHDRGELLLGGALSEPVDRGILLFQGDSPAVVEQFVQADPYVRHGLVTHWQIRPWNTVVGNQASSPVRPTTRNE